MALARREERLCQEYATEMKEVYAVSDFLESVSTGDKALKRLHADFVSRLPGVKLTLGRFRRALMLLGYAWRVSTRVFRKRPNHGRVSFLAFRQILRRLAHQPSHLFFFDCSTFLFEQNPRRSWQTRLTPTAFFSSTNYRRFHLLLVIGETGPVAHQIIAGKVPKGAVASFLARVCQRLREACGEQPVTVVLDNAQVHKTELMRRLAGSTGVCFLFTAPHSPFMNPIELVFRRIKAGHRNRHEIKE